MVIICNFATPTQHNAKRPQRNERHQALGYTLWSYVFVSVGSDLTYSRGLFILACPR